MARFFIDRPVFAGVLSILIGLIGSIAYFALPLAQYPNVAPPTISVSASYSGANARAVADSVATIIEDQVNGVEGMLYMESSSSNDGRMNLSVTFETGTNLDDALVLVQNRVSLATAKLPEKVKKVGVTVRKRSPTVLMMINFISPSKTFDQVYLSNFVSLRVRDAISRVEGVGDISIWGEKAYSMRVWLDPQKIAVMGSSAGGHLAGMVSTYLSPIEGEGADEIDREDFLPDATILCYPVCHMPDETKVAHVGSFDNLCGGKIPYAAVSNDLNVTDETPPAFIWHTSDDAGVNVINSYLYAAALRRHGIPHEVHVFPHGAHGLGLAQSEPHVAQWAGLMKNWLVFMGWLN